MFDRDRMLEAQLDEAVNEGLIDRKQANTMKKYKKAEHEDKRRDDILDTQKESVPDEVRDVFKRLKLSNSKSHSRSSSDEEKTIPTEFDAKLSRMVNRVHQFQDLYGKEPTSMKWDKVKTQKLLTKPKV